MVEWGENPKRRELKRKKIKGVYTILTVLFFTNREERQVLYIAQIGAYI